MPVIDESDMNDLHESKTFEQPCESEVRKMHASQQSTEQSNIAVTKDSISLSLLNICSNGSQEPVSVSSVQGESGNYVGTEQ